MKGKKIHINKKITLFANKADELLNFYESLYRLQFGESTSV